MTGAIAKRCCEAQIAKENIVSNSISLSIDLRMDYMGCAVLEGIDSLADEENDDNDENE
jgi:hypothetical protein